MKTLEQIVALHRQEWAERSRAQQQLEIENNEAVAKLYGLEDEVPSYVPLERVSLTNNSAFRWPNKTPEERDVLFTESAIIDLVSYAVGCMLGRYSLDELPQIFNVMRGDMSLVGPRPLLVQYLERYSPEQARRHEVRPGITGLAQVSGRNSLDWDDKLALDVEYVDNHNLWLDARILARTLGLVFRRDGISADGEATMPVFRGSAGQGMSNA